MGNLPNSRTNSINTGDPVPPALLNEIQDQIIGGFHGAGVYPIAGTAFAPLGAATRSGITWTLTNDASLAWSMELPVGTQVTAIEASLRVITPPSVSGFLSVDEISFGDGSVTGVAVATVSLPAAGAWQILPMTMTPFSIRSGFVYSFTLQTTGACNVLFDGIRVSRKKSA